jgi:hypothetical protein
MHGRSYLSLLALALILLPSCLCAQANPPDHSAGGRNSTSQFAPYQFTPTDNISFPIVGPNDARRRIPAARQHAFGFADLARAAGTIFSGTVTAIERGPASQSQAIETVSITFHVEYAIRGATSGENLTISQWIGIWSSGQRYRVGERVLLFLYPPSKLGLTSCVGAGLGRLDADPRGRIVFSAQQVEAFRTDPVLGGKSSVSFPDLVWAVHQSETARPGNAGLASEAP